MTEKEHIGSVAMGDSRDDGQCPRPCNGRPDDFSMRSCIEAGECGCIAFPSRPAQEPVAVNLVGWQYEDELPSSYPYDVMYTHSKVDGVRMFPVFAPQPAQDPVGHCVWISSTKLAACAKSSRGSFPVYAAPQPAHGTSATERAPAVRVEADNREFDTSRSVTEAEIRQWAVLRADDAGFLARQLINEKHSRADLLKALGDCRSSICGYSLSGSPKQAEDAVVSMFNEIQRIDGIARAALAKENL